MEFVVNNYTGGEYTNTDIRFIFNDWNVDCYVVVPAAVYGANRFRIKKEPYPPMFDEDDESINPPVTITDVPRLSITGESKLQLTTGDCATPAVGIFNPITKKGCWILTEQGTALGLSGISITENEDKTSASVILTAPYFREGEHYRWPYMIESTDTRIKLSHGEAIDIPYIYNEFDCESVTELYKEFFSIRNTYGSKKRMNQLPFSEAWKILENHSNIDLWNKTDEHYKLSAGELPQQNWQPGWCGGGMNTYALLELGNDMSKQRAMKTLDYLFSTQAESGFFHGMAIGKKMYGDGFGKPHAKNYHLIRKSADVCYFLIKQFILLDRLNIQIPQEWKEKTFNLCDAFVRLWEKYGQFGQFVDIYTGEIKIGGSTSAVMAIGGLASAGKYFNEKKYIDTAKISAEFYYTRDIKKGITTGGPGEILQNPDSESIFAMLESLVVLYEVSGSNKWLEYAKYTAYQCSSWCMSYDYNFPDYSEFYRLDMKTTGSVFANIQNKHSAPGICTLSGNSLLKLYRATGDERFLTLISEIAHNLPQYLSRDDRPIMAAMGIDGEAITEALPSGVMCERVNTSDWEGKENIGAVFNCSCWCEVSLMLVCAELPGIYIVKDKNVIAVFDNVDAVLQDNELIITNNTMFDANVNLYIENNKDLKNMWDLHSQRNNIFLKKGEKISLMI